MKDAYHFRPGDIVRITSDAVPLPMPQCLYAGQMGRVISTSVTYVYVSPNDALSGAHATGGVPFLPSEIERVES